MAAGPGGIFLWRRAACLPSVSSPQAMALTVAPIDFAALVDSSISRPARYLGNERGVEPRDWSAARVRWALTYPEVYEVGASNLGHVLL